MKRRTLFISFLLGVLLALALGSGARSDELERSFPAADGGRLRIALDFGQVELVPAQTEVVRIEARSRGVGASGVHFDAVAEGGNVVLTSRTEPWVAWLRTLPRVQVRAFVPSSWAIDLPEVGAGADASLASYVVHEP